MLQEKVWVLGTRTPALGGNVRPTELRGSRGNPVELGSLHCTAGERVGSSQYCIDLRPIVEIRVSE
jgi:hypothetical protein